jgi:hypothetical protein
MSPAISRSLAYSPVPRSATVSPAIFRSLAPHPSAEIFYGITRTASGVSTRSFR